MSSVIQMREVYDKLVRDGIPEIITEAGIRYEVKILCEREFIQALKNKLVEEAKEALESSNSEELIEELADLYEVIDALAIATNLKKATVLSRQRQKREEKGGFERRFQLLWIEKN